MLTWQKLIMVQNFLQIYSEETLEANCAQSKELHYVVQVG